MKMTVKLLADEQLLLYIKANETCHGRKIHGYNGYIHIEWISNEINNAEHVNIGMFSLAPIIDAGHATMHGAL